MADTIRPPPSAPNSPDGSMAPVPVSKKLSDCRIAHVTVFRDRAEVSRVIHLTENEVGQGAHDIVLRGLPANCDADSLRVRGSGLFQILEVAMEVNYISPDTSNAGKLEELREELKTLEARQNVINQSMARTVQMKSLVQEYMTQAKRSADGPGGLTVEAMRQVLQMYDAQQGSLDTVHNHDTKELLAVTEKMNFVRSELQRFQSAMSGPVQSRDVTISIAVTAPNDHLELVLSYVVRGASWQPCYDMRIASASGEQTILYYGVVTQGTGEDWTGCTLSLSTATPAVHGAPPALHSKFVSFYTEPAVQEVETIRRRRIMKREVAEDDDSLAMGSPESKTASLADSAPTARVMHSTVKANNLSGSSVFEIPRAVFIESDMKPHKVTITTLVFPATLAYYAAPSVSPHAYLQAKARNESDYPLLASDRMAVYVDSTFVAKTEMKTVNPGEIFSTYLGVDPTIKIEYRVSPTKTRSVGWMSKTTQTTYEFCTVVTNTKSSPALVFIADSVPRADTDKVTVELQAPNTEALTSVREVLGMDETHTEEISYTDAQLIDHLITPGAHGAVVVHNPTSSNLVWMQVVPPSQRVSLPLRYMISNPADTQLQVA